MRRRRASFVDLFLTRPLSTVPGPTSTYVVTPSDARRRTTASHAPAPTPGAPAPRSAAARVALRLARRRWRRPAPAGRAAGSARSSGASRSSAGFISAQWNGALTGQRHGALARPSALRALGGPLHGGRRAGDHHLSRAVDVRRADDLALRRLLARPRHGLQVAAENRRHRAGADRHRLLHVAPAPPHDRHRVAEHQACRRRRWPSTRPGCARRRRRAECRAPTSTRQAAMLAVRIAGCVFSVSVS